MKISLPIISILRLPSRNALLASAVLLLLLSAPLAAVAGSATWNLAPVSNEWNGAANWTPMTVPNGPADIATFDVSNTTGIAVSAPIILGGIVFNPGASAFTITVGAPFSFFIDGAGITNNSGVTQNFVTATDTAHNQGDITLVDNATAGDATYTNFGAVVGGAFGGHVDFFNSANAGNGHFIVGGGAVRNADGAGIEFFDDSNAASGTFNINGGAVNTAGGGHVEFIHTSTAGHAKLVGLGGLGGGDGGAIFFFDDSTGDAARVALFDNGTLDISFHNLPGVTIGSLQGDGLVFLGARNLTAGNARKITFLGVIADGGSAGGAGGSLTKVGSGRLALSGSNTYTGGTTIKAGTLLVNNPPQAGSGTGSGPVRVSAGALGGIGTIAGPVTVGSGTPGGGAFLTPGINLGNPGTLTIEGALSFDSDGFFNVGLARNEVVGEVVANGVTIDASAQFAFPNIQGFTVPVGTVLTLINNTAATPIAGVFENLPDGLVFTDHGNVFAVSYEGGDGNDLTLTSQ